MAGDHGGAPLPVTRHPLPAMAGDHGGAPLPATRHPSPASSLWTLLFAGYMLVYVLVHATFSFQAWDRYLLPLAPLLALLAGRGLEVLWLRGRGQETRRLGLTVALVAVLAWGAGQAVLARIPVGGDHGAYAGIEQVASYLHQHVPAVRGVLYQRWLGWHWDWYLWDGPRGRVYWSDPAMIVADLHADPLGYERYVVFPGWQEAERPALEAALAPYHLRLAPGLTVRRADGGLQFTVYQFVREASR